MGLEVGLEVGMRWVLGKSRWVPKIGEVGMPKVGMSMSVARGRPWSPVSVVFPPPLRSLSHPRPRWVGRPTTWLDRTEVAAAVSCPPRAVSARTARAPREVAGADETGLTKGDGGEAGWPMA